jgi:hypothetical protein
MTMDEFVNGMNELRRKHNFCIQEDCDLWSLMQGFLFFRDYKSEKPFAHITGVRYRRDGSGLEGDFEGVLELMTESVNDEYKKTNQESKQ